MRRIGIWMCVAAATVSLTGCEQRGETPTTRPASSAPTTGDEDASWDELKQKTRETVDAAGRMIREARERYAEEVERELARLDEHIDNLEKRAREASDDARPAIEKQIETWTRRAQAARETLKKLAGASDEAWQQMKEGLDDAVDEFREAVSESPTSQPVSEPGE